MTRRNSHRQISFNTTFISFTPHSLSEVHFLLIVFFQSHDTENFAPLFTTYFSSKHALNSQEIFPGEVIDLKATFAPED